MMTQALMAQRGTVTPEMEKVAAAEGIPIETLRQLLATGRVVIPANRLHSRLVPIGIGKGLRTKVNANIGTSGDFSRLDDELQKLNLVIAFRADTVMDLSTGGDISAIRRALLARSTIPFGTVPVYQMAVTAASRERKFVETEVDEMFTAIEEQAAEGVDFMTIHAGLTRRALDKVRERPRKAGIVSRGGSILAGWMLHRRQENPFYEHFDRLLQIAGAYDVTLSLGDGLRPGALADGSDWAQLEELLTLGELVKRARAAGVQVMVEGPGHLPLPQIEMNIKLQKTVCDEAPFYVLGPVVTDIAPGYDHLTAAIGSVVAGAAGADFLCYVTPSEHLGLPDAEDVKEGIIALRIAAHVVDIAKGVPGAMEWDNRMAEARCRLDWEAQKELSINPEKFQAVRRQRSSQTDACSMCGDFCVYKIQKDFFSHG